MKIGKNPMGRPPKTLKDLPENWETKMIEMGNEGMFDIDAIVWLGIGSQLFYKWVDENKHFSNTINEMRQLSHTWWASIPRKGFKEGKSKDLNSNLWSLIMRNKFSWHGRTRTFNLREHSNKTAPIG